MAKIGDTLNSLALIGVLAVLLLCYRRLCDVEDISRLRLKSQQSEERGRAETEKGERLQFEQITMEVKAISQRADYQDQELKILRERSESDKIKVQAQKWIDTHPFPWRTR